jgi:hypothetical protein
LIIAQLLWITSLHNLLCSLDQRVQVVIGANVKLLETLEELVHVFHSRVTKDFGLAVTLACQSFDQVLDQLGKLVAERLLGELHGFIEPLLDTLAFLLVKLGIQLLQVVWRFNGWKVPVQREQTFKRLRIVRRIVQRAEPLYRR